MLCYYVHKAGENCIPPKAYNLKYTVVNALKFTTISNLCTGVHVHAFISATDSFIDESGVS